MAKKEDIHGPMPRERGFNFNGAWCSMCAKFIDYSKTNATEDLPIEPTCEIIRALSSQRRHKWPGQWKMLFGFLQCDNFKVDFAKLRELYWQRYTHIRTGRPWPCYKCEYSRCSRHHQTLPASNFSSIWRCAHPKNRHPDRYPEISFQRKGGRTEMVCDVDRKHNWPYINEVDL